MGPFIDGQSIASKHFLCSDAKLVSEALERHFRNGINPLWANDNRILEELHFIHQVGFEQALRNVGATFDEKAIDAPEAKLLQGIGEIHPAVGRLPAIDNGNPGADPAFAGGENPDRHLFGSFHEFCLGGNGEARIGHDADW